jgi:hypothetical protein
MEEPRCARCGGEGLTTEHGTEQGGVNVIRHSSPECTPCSNRVRKSAEM